MEQPAPQKSNESDVTQRRPQARYGVSAQEFITAWETSDSAQEAADRVNMPKAIAQARASGYRKRGLNLKHMPRGMKPLDVDRLNAFIQQLHHEQAAESA